MTRNKSLVSAAIVSLAIGSTAAQADTLENVTKKGYVQCGVSTGLPGFSNPDEKETGLESM